jgi:hypothetical protein
MGVDNCVQQLAVPLPQIPPEIVVGGPADDDEEWYGRFSERRKKIMVAVVGLLTFLAPFSIAAVLPAIPEVAAALHTTGSVINFTNAAFLVTMSISPCFCAPWTQVSRFISD